MVDNAMTWLLKYYAGIKIVCIEPAKALIMSELSESFVRSILSADAVGFSKLVSKNEYETLASLKQCIDIFSEVIES